MIIKYIGLVIVIFACCLPVFAQPETTAQSPAAGASRGAGERGVVDTRISTLNYDTGQVGLDDKDLREIKRLIRLMKMNPDIRMSVQGHTDDRGKIMDNQRLSEYRAWLVWAFMVSNGIPHHRLEFVGFGFRKPKVGEVTDEARKENRRVEVHLIK